jgi:hypothetical protein
MVADDRRRSPPGIVWSWPTASSALWAVASGLRGPRTFAGLNRSMYRITCPSRARLHARSRVLAHASWPDVPDNRPLSDACACRVRPGRGDRASNIFVWVLAGLAGGPRGRPGCGDDDLAVVATPRPSSDGSRGGRDGHVLGQRQSPGDTCTLAVAMLCSADDGRGAVWHFGAAPVPAAAWVTGVQQLLALRCGNGG